MEGNIESDTVVVCGYFKGTIRVKRIIEVKTPANIIGDLIADSVRVESGVAIQGNVEAKTPIKSAKDPPATIETVVAKATLPNPGSRRSV